MRLKTTMTSKALAAMLLTTAATAFAAQPYTGGIALDKTEKLAQTSIPLPNGRPDAVLALAMRHGRAKGHFSGRAAAAIKQQYGKEIPIHIEAVKKEAVKGKAGCNKVTLTFKTTPEFERMAPTQSVDIEVCPNRNK